MTIVMWGVAGFFLLVAIVLAALIWLRRQWEHDSFMAGMAEQERTRDAAHRQVAEESTEAMLTRLRGTQQAGTQGDTDAQWSQAQLAAAQQAKQSGLNFTERLMHSKALLIADRCARSEVELYALTWPPGQPGNPPVYTIDPAHYDGSDEHDFQRAQDAVTYLQLRQRVGATLPERIEGSAYLVWFEEHANASA